MVWGNVIKLLTETWSFITRRANSLAAPHQKYNSSNFKERFKYMNKNSYKIRWRKNESLAYGKNISPCG